MPGRRLAGPPHRDRLHPVSAVAGPFQALGRGQAFQDMFALRCVGLQPALHRFQALLQPLPLFGVADVHELGAD